MPDIEMEGPKLISLYSCKFCAHIQRKMGNYNCGKKSSSTFVTYIFDYETPDWCPYLKKQIRKDKLQKINEIKDESR